MVMQYVCKLCSEYCLIIMKQCLHLTCVPTIILVIFKYHPNKTTRFVIFSSYRNAIDSSLFWFSKNVQL